MHIFTLEEDGTLAFRASTAENEGQERVRASYRHNYERLSQIKRKYDPHNLFRRNQNIEPAPVSPAIVR